MSIDGIGENEIANYLAHNPGFFERHAELLASVQLASPHGARAVSLQERQIEMLRERIRGLEAKIMEMIRHGQENVAITERLHRWTRALLLTRAPSELPATMVRELKSEFLVPRAAIRVWAVDAAFAGEPFAQGVSSDTRSFAGSLTLPYCGAHAGFEAVRWLDDPGSVASVAIVPLRAAGGVIGLLVLGSPDPTRYAADMGTEFLARLGELAGAALARLT